MGGVLGKWEGFGGSGRGWEKWEGLGEVGEVLGKVEEVLGEVGGVLGEVGGVLFWLLRDYDGSTFMAMSQLVAMAACE